MLTYFIDVQVKKKKHNLHIIADGLGSLITEKKNYYWSREVILESPNYLNFVDPIFKNSY